MIASRHFDLPAISVVATVLTSDASDEAIMSTLVVQWFVKVILVMAAPCTVAVLIRNRTISTLKIVDAIFFAISVFAAPMPHRETLKTKTKIVCQCLVYKKYNREVDKPVNEMSAFVCIGYDSLRSVRTTSASIFGSSPMS